LVTTQIVISPEGAELITSTRDAARAAVAATPVVATAAAPIAAPFRNVLRSIFFGSGVIVVSGSMTSPFGFGRHVSVCRI
jgi:hypothetical protein